MSLLNSFFWIKEKERFWLNSSTVDILVISQISIICWVAWHQLILVIVEAYKNLGSHYLMQDNTWQKESVKFHILLLVWN